MVKVIVYHDLYGCETGCCGHWVQIYPDSATDPYIDPTLSREEGGKYGFVFDHPSNLDKMSEEKQIAFAKEVVVMELGEEHVKDLDWEHCILLEE